MKISKNQVLTAIIIIVVMVLLLPKSSLNSFDGFEMLLFIIIGFISIVEIIKEIKKRSYSLNLIHWLFVFFFYYLAPIQQIANDYQPWGLSIGPSDVNKTCCIIILWILVYKIGYRFFSKKNEKKEIQNERIVENINISNISLVIVTLINIVCGIFFIKSIGFSNLFARKTSTLSLEAVTGSSKQIINLLLDHGLKSIIPFSTAISLINYIQNKKGIIFLIINAIILLIVCFPTGLGRSEAANMYLGLFVILLYRRIDKNRKSLKYILLFISSFIIVFPAINAFRNISFGKVDIKQEIVTTIDDISNTYLAGDYDAFTMINQTRLYANENDVTYGRQLLGAILFFVPRKIWIDKPLGSGYSIFSSLDKAFKNVSCPLIAEGYINFGVFGVILFALLFSILTCYIDNCYWDMINQDEKISINLLTILYPFLLPSYYILQRGDLLSILPFTVAIIVAFSFMFKVVKIFSININNKVEATK